jgi:hypothetical protein
VAPGPDFAKAVRAGIRTALASLKRLHTGALTERHRFSFAFAAPAAGTLTARLSTTAKLTRAVAARAVTLATGRRVFAAPGTERLTVRLNAMAITALHRARQVPATLALNFAPTSGTNASANQTLPRRR